MTCKKEWFLLFSLFLNTEILEAQTARRWIPPPLRAYVPLERAWNQMLTTLKERDPGIVRDSRNQGSITTDFHEYSSGPLTESDIAKIGREVKLADADWVRVEYQIEVLIEPIQARETLITVHANIKALKREFLGKESWIEISSNGRLEEDLLTEFGEALFGKGFTLRTQKKGYWERDAVYLPHPYERIPKIVGPEKPPD